MRNEKALRDESFFGTTARDDKSIPLSHRPSQLPQVVNLQMLRIQFGSAAVDRLGAELAARSLAWPVHLVERMLCLREQAETIKNSCDRSQDLTQAAEIQ